MLGIYIFHWSTKLFILQVDMLALIDWLDISWTLPFIQEICAFNLIRSDITDSDSVSVEVE